jgi:hypothetical protein
MARNCFLPVYREERRKKKMKAKITLVGLILLLGFNFSFGVTFTETFETTDNCDTSNTNADWSEGKLKLNQNPVVIDKTAFSEICRNCEGMTIVGDYIYINNRGEELIIADISNPLLPRVIGDCYIEHTAGEIVISNGYAYMISWKGGLTIVDISTPTSPLVKGRLKIEGRFYSQNDNIAVSGNYVYTAGTKGLSIIDVTDPTKPELVGEYNYEKDTMIYSVAISESYIYAGHSSGLLVLNISDPTKPILVGKCDEVCASTRIVIVGRYAYTGSRWREPGFQIVDISKPEVPVLIGQCADYANKHLYDMAISGNYAYLTTDSGSDVIDISKPTAPKLDGSYEKGSYIAISGDYAYLSSYFRIYILSISKPYSSPNIAQSRVVSEKSSQDIHSAILIPTQDVGFYGAVFYQLSNNGGKNWVDVTPMNKIIFSTKGSSLRWRAKLSTSNKHYTPTVEKIVIEYEYSPIIVSPITLTTLESEDELEFTVKIALPPTGDVIIPVSSSDLTEGIVVPEQLVFTPANWEEPQKVTVHSVNDKLADGDISYRVILSPAVSNDPNYNNAESLDVTVKNIDNEIVPNGEWQKPVVVENETFRPSCIKFYNGNTYLVYGREKGGVIYALYDKSIHSWKKEVISEDKAGSISLAFDSSGSPHVAWPSGQKILYAVKKDNRWQINNVEVGEYVQRVCLVIDKEGNPAISYYRWQGALKLARWDGDDWEISVIKGPKLYISDYSMTVDTEGNFLIAYEDDGLEYACGNGGEWKITTIDDSPKSSFVSITSNEKGKIGISYCLRFGCESCGEYESELRCAYWTGEEWEIMTIDGDSEYAGRYCSIAMNSSGNIAISYLEGGYAGNQSWMPEDLKCAYYSKSVGWKVYRVDVKGVVGWDTSIDMDMVGNVGISYYDISEKRLKYIYSEVDEEVEIGTPLVQSLELFHSYPNPFNPECYIPVNAKGKGQNVKCKIYNILGQLVREIECSRVQEFKGSRVYWDGKDSRGLEVPAGVYFYEVAGEGVRRMIVLR